MTEHPKVQNRVHIANEAEQWVSWEAGALVAAFGKGNLQAVSLEKVNPQQDVLYTLVDGNTQVIFDNEITTVAAVFQSRQKVDPTAHIMYHAMEEVPGQTFKLRRESCIIFTPCPMGQMNSMELQIYAASLIPVCLWEGAQTTLVWSLRWQSGALMPERPHVVFKRAGVLEGAHALPLTS